MINGRSETRLVARGRRNEKAACEIPEASACRNGVIQIQKTLNSEARRGDETIIGANNRIKNASEMNVNTMRDLNGGKP